MTRRLVMVAVVALATLAAGTVALVRAQADDDDVIHLTRSDRDVDGGSQRQSHPLPDVIVYDDRGDEVALGTLVGTPLVINVWYSNCPPCRRELPAFATVHRELGDRVRFIGINPVDRDGADAFARDLGVQFELLRDPDGLLLAAAQIDGFPSTLLVDEAGTVVVHHTGAMTADELRTAITQELLA